MDDAGLIQRVQSCLARGLPNLGWEPSKSSRLKIIANGPSARAADLSGETMALNGALKLFTDKGLAPTYWTACDPQELVAGFLDSPPLSTIYLVCSKCHPSVFERLKDRQVIVWHLDDFGPWDLVKDLDPIRLACSVTICAFEVGERLGYQSFETWGWDACYLDGLNHANSQFHIVETITNEIGTEEFVTTRTWLLEGQDAVNKFRQTKRDVIIHGEGMIKALFDYLQVSHGREAVSV